MVWLVTVNWKDGTTTTKTFKKYSNAENYAYNKIMPMAKCKTFKLEEIAL